MNDSKNFCESDPNNPRYPDKTNSVGRQDMSNLYYPWVNQIDEGVLEAYPNKYFSLLAYSNVYDPPTNVELNSHVIPYITSDRMSWGDPAMKDEGHEHVEQWQGAATNLGWYE